MSTVTKLFEACEGKLRLRTTKFSSAHLPFVFDVLVDKDGNCNSSESIVPARYEHQTYTQCQTYQGQGPENSQNTNNYNTNNKGSPKHELLFFLSLKTAALSLLELFIDSGEQEIQYHLSMALFYWDSSLIQLNKR